MQRCGCRDNYDASLDLRELQPLNPWILEPWTPSF